MDKAILLRRCHLRLNQRKVQIEQAISDAEMALQEETKSSAGDKYETTREMIQQDLGRLAHQKMMISQDEALLGRILDRRNSTPVVGLGSLVYTEDGFVYFLSVGIGKLVIDKHTIYAISIESPLASKLISKIVGDKVEFNNVFKKIIRVV